MSNALPDDSLLITPAQPLARRSRQARVVWGDRVVTLGGDAPVRVQSMTNTDTVDVIGTAIQVKELAIAGSELVRITVNTPEAAQAVPHIREQLDRMGIDVPLIGDFHYNGHTLLTEYPACAAALSKYRINPGNVGKGHKRDRQFAQMIEAACRHDIPGLDPVGAAIGGLGAGTRHARRTNHHQLQGQRRAGLDHGLPGAQQPLRLPAAPGSDRGRHGNQRHGGLRRGDGSVAAARHRRHDPGQPDAATW
jgi:hypothetical protein